MQIRTGNNENQTINISGAAQEGASKRAGRKAQAQKRTTISAAELGLGKGQDIIERRRMRAKQRAMKAVTDAWGSDKKIDRDVSDIREKIKYLQEDIEKTQPFLEQSQEKMAHVREQYGVAEDSQEQKDLELLLRGKELGILASDKLSRAEREKMAEQMGETLLTMDEEMHLWELQEQPLTDYQKDYIELYDQETEFSKRIESAQSQIEGGYASITAIRLERLKFHGMVDAQNKADEIMEQAGEEIMGLLVDEAKDHVDATYEEQREEAKEKAEEKEAQEEQIEARREEKQKLEEQIEVIREERQETEASYKEQARNARQDKELLENAVETGMDAGGAATGIKAEIRQILHKMNLLEEDLKGSMVDEEL